MSEGTKNKYVLKVLKTSREGRAIFYLWYIQQNEREWMKIR